jgi:hypothetical protein
MNLFAFPKDVICEILLFLKLEEIIVILRLCKGSKKLVTNDFWKLYLYQYFGRYDRSNNVIDWKEEFKTHFLYFSFYCFSHEMTRLPKRNIFMQDENQASGFKIQTLGNLKSNEIYEWRLEAVRSQPECVRSYVCIGLFCRNTFGAIETQYYLEYYNDLSFLVKVNIKDDDIQIHALSTNMIKNFYIMNDESVDKCCLRISTYGISEIKIVGGSIQNAFTKEKKSFSFHSFPNHSTVNANFEKNNQEEISRWILTEKQNHNESF